MRGKLTVKGLTKDTFALTIYDVIVQLQNFEQVEFAKATETGVDYFDVVKTVYKDAAVIDDLGEILLPKFYEAMQNLFSNPEHEARLRELGATDLDFAFINNDVDAVVRIANSNQETNPYILAKQYRMCELRDQIHAKDPATPKLQFAHMITLGDAKIPPFDIEHAAFVSQAQEEKPGKLLVNISGYGGKTWGPGYTKSVHEKIKTIF